MTGEERFLNAATRGLSRKARSNVQAELRSHLHERTQQLILDGTEEAEARKQARTELGPPPAIAHSLRRGEQVHPALSALALTGLAALLLLPLPTFFREQWLAGAWGNTATLAELHVEGAMSLTQARQQLRPLGIGLTREDGLYVLTHPRFPDAKLGADGPRRCYAPYYSEAQDTPALPFSQTPRNFYISMSTLLSCMSLAGWPLEIRAGQIFLNEQAFSPVDAANFIHDTRESVLTMLYAPAIAASLSQLPKEVWFSEVDFVSVPDVQPLYSIRPTRTVKLFVSAGSPVLILVKSWNAVTVMPSQKVHRFPTFASTVVWADKKGQIEVPLKSTLFHTFNQPIQLHVSLKSWEAAPLDQNAAILLPLTEQVSNPIKLQPLKPL